MHAQSQRLGFPSKKRTPVEIFVLLAIPHRARPSTRVTWIRRRSGVALSWLGIDSVIDLQLRCIHIDLCCLLQGRTRTLESWGRR